MDDAGRTFDMLCKVEGGGMCESFFLLGKVMMMMMMICTLFPAI